MKRFCVIGDPVGHSRSPDLHLALQSAVGAAYTYEAVRVREAALPGFVAAAKAGAWDGCNVTMPLKRAILPLLEELTPTAGAVGAVNTVRFDGGCAVGHNTDGAGFLLALEQFGFDAAGKTAALLGAGGAARSVALALAETGMTVLVANRTAKAAEALAALHPAVFVSSETEALPQCDLLINATPRGMTEKWASLDFLRLLPPKAAVFDLVYDPAETPLLAAARARGHPCCNGYAMLCGQAVAAAEFFHGAALDRPALLRRLMTEE